MDTEARRAASGAPPPARLSADQRDAFAESTARIVRESLARGRTYERLEELCRVAPRRLAGTPDSLRAVEWARRVMEEDGLQDVRLEPCTVPVWWRGEVEQLEIVEPRSLAGTRLPVCALGGSIATPTDGVEGDLVIVTSFEQLEALGTAGARDRIVLFNRPMPDELVNPFEAYGAAVGQRSQGAIRAAQVSAVASLVRSMTTRRDDSPHSGGMSYTDGVVKIPAAAVSTNAADQLAELVARGQRVRLRLTLDCEPREPAESFNVVGDLPGRELPEEIVLVGGHIDSWSVGGSTGAHDDGAGCCHALEVPRLLQALDLVPRRTIRVVMFMNEENGTAGARAYRDAHADEMARHFCALESDNGGFTPRGFTVDGPDEALALVKELAAPLASIGAGRITPGSGGVDIGFLKPRGVPLIGFRPDPQRYFDVHHSENDVLASVSRRELHLGAAAVTSLVYMLAETDAPLARNEVSE